MAKAKVLEQYAKDALFILESALMFRGQAAFGDGTLQVSEFCKAMRKDLGWPEFGQKEKGGPK